MMSSAECCNAMKIFSNFSDKKQDELSRLCKHFLPHTYSQLSLLPNNYGCFQKPGLSGLSQVFAK
jgi:hypothetical protein